jgi:hypothetical protein
MSCGLQLDRTMPPLIAGSDAATGRLYCRMFPIAGAIVKPFLPLRSFPPMTPAIPWIAPGPIRKALPPLPAAAALKVKFP